MPKATVVAKSPTGKVLVFKSEDGKWENQTILIKDVRLSHLHAFKKRAFEEGQTAKHSVTAIIPLKDRKDDVVFLRNYMLKMAKEFIKVALPAEKLCLRNGNDTGKEEYKNAWILVAREEKRPIIVDTDGRTPLAEEDGKPYSGCYGNVLIRPWAQNNKFGKRINSNFLSVQFLRDGEAFGGSSRPAAEDVFDDASEDASDFSESGDLDDDDGL